MVFISESIRKNEESANTSFFESPFSRKALFVGLVGLAILFPVHLAIAAFLTASSTLVKIVVVLFLTSTLSTPYFVSKIFSSATPPPPAPPLSFVLRREEERPYELSPNDSLYKVYQEGISVPPPPMPTTIQDSNLTTSDLYKKEISVPPPSPRPTTIQDGNLTTSDPLDHLYKKEIPVPPPFPAQATIQDGNSTTSDLYKKEIPVPPPSPVPTTIQEGNLTTSDPLDPLLILARRFKSE